MENYNVKLKKSMNKVVKCKNVKCAQYFTHTEKNTKCPFCYTEFGEVEEETKDLSAPASPELKRGEQTRKKEVKKIKF